MRAGRQGIDGGRARRRGVAGFLRGFGSRSLLPALAACLVAAGAPSSGRAEIRDDRQACMTLAAFPSRAGGVADDAVDLDAAASRCEAAVEGNPPDFAALAHLGRVHWLRGERLNESAEHETARELGRRAAGQWQPEGLFLLGLLAERDGDGEEAQDWFLRAAERDLVAACLKAATGFGDGVGTGEDMVEAGHWLARCRQGADDAQRQQIETYGNRLAERLIERNAERLEDAGYVGSLDNARAVLRIVDFNEAFFGPDHPLSTYARQVLDDLTALMHDQDATHARLSSIQDELDAARGLSERGAFLAAAAKAQRAFASAQRLAAADTAGERDHSGAAQSTLALIWLGVIPDIALELRNADFFDGIVPHQRLKDAEALDRLLGDYASDFHDPEEFAFLLQKAKARWAAFGGDIDGAASLYEDAYRREAGRAGAGDPAAAVPPTPPFASDPVDHDRLEWFRKTLLEAAAMVADDRKPVEEQVLAVRKPFLDQDPSSLLRLYTANFTVLDADGALAALIDPAFEKGFAFEPDMRDADSVFDAVAAEELQWGRDWHGNTLPILSDRTVPAANRLARVAAAIEEAGGSPFPIEENIRLLVDLHHAGEPADRTRVEETALELQNIVGIMAPALWSARLGEAVLEIHPDLASAEAFRAKIGRVKYTVLLDGTGLLLKELVAAGEDKDLLRAIAGRTAALRTYALSEPAARSIDGGDPVVTADNILRMARDRARLDRSLAISALLQLASLGAVSAGELPALLTLRDFATTHLEHDNDLLVHQALERVRNRARIGLEIAILSAMRSVMVSDGDGAAGLADEAALIASVAFAEDAPERALVDAWRASIPGLPAIGRTLDPAVRQALGRAAAISADVQKELDAVPLANFSLFDDAGDGDRQDADRRPLKFLAMDALARVEAIRRMDPGTVPDSVLSSIPLAVEEFQNGAYPFVARSLADAAADHYRKRRGFESDAAFMDRRSAQAAVLAGDFDGAFAAYERAIASLVGAQLTDQPHFKALLLDMAGLYARTGRSDIADSILNAFPDVLPIVTRPGVAFPMAALDAGISGLQASSMGFLRDFWMSALGPTADSMAELFLADGDTASAGIWAAALDVANATDMLNSWDLNAAFLRAKISLAQGRHTEAAAALGALVETVAPQDGPAGSPSPLAAATVRLALARARASVGDMAGAAASARLAFEEVAHLDQGDNPVLAAFHWEAGNIAMADARPGDAVASYREAVRRVRDPATGFLRGAVWDPGWADRFTPHRALDDLLDALWMAGGASGDAAIAAEAFETAQLSALAEAATAISAAAIRNRTTDPAIRALLRQRQDAVRRLAALHDMLADNIAAASDVVAAASPEDVRREIAALDSRLAALSPDLSLALTPRSTSLADLRLSLEPGDAVVKVRSGETVTHAFLVDRDRIVWRRVEIAEEELRRGVAALRHALDPVNLGIRGATSLVEGRENAFPFAAAHELYAAIFRDLLESGGRMPGHVFYEANGPLETLPLQILLRSPAAAGGIEARLKSADWLARHVAITVVPSVAAIAMPAPTASSEARRPFFGIGAPDFAGPVRLAANDDAERPGSASFRSLFRGGSADLDAIASLAPLPEARTELLAIGRSLGEDGSVVLTGGDATQRALLAQPLDAFRVVAFATHGLVAGEISRLAEPALALTPVDGATPDDDGLLTMSEVAQLNLDSDWVLLSACNTASSDGRGGSGALSGLAQAFFYAGARRLLVSNWPVISEAAVRLTTSTMASYSGGGDRPAAEALQDAILAILERPQASILELHPAYWGPFSLVSRLR